MHIIRELRSCDHLVVFPIYLSYLRALPAPQVRRLSHPCTCSFCCERESYLLCTKRSQKPRKLKPRARASPGLGAQQNLAPPPSLSPCPRGEKRWEGAGSRKLLHPQSSGWWPRGRSRGGAVETLRGAQAPAPAWGVGRDGGAQPRQRCRATAAWPARAFCTIGVVADRVSLDRHPIPPQHFCSSATRLLPRVERSGSPGAGRLLGAAGP